MKILKAEYLQSAGSVSQCPKPDKPEFAFIGRSNVGKSSLINYLTGQNGLALTSSRPGKTKSINHFIVDDAWYLVDLPGYGYAQTSRTERVKWLDMARDYLRQRENLVSVFLLIDASIPAQQKDIDFANWLGSAGIPFCIVFTKTDKAKAIAVKHHLREFNEKMLESWEELPPEILTSAGKKQGREGLLEYIGQNISAYRKAV